MSEGLSFEERWKQKKNAMKAKVAVPDNPPQPDFSQPPPQTINTTRRRDGVLYVAGEGNKEEADIMFVMPTLLGEDALEFRTAYRSSEPIPDPPAYMKSLSGVILKDLLSYVGIPVQNCYFTAICKWLLPKAKRLKPDTGSLKFAEPSFISELDTVKPKIVVCLGKAAFDFFCPVKYKADDIRAGWFYSSEYNCKYILLDPVYLLASRPDYVEKFKINLYEVKSAWDESRGVEIPRIATDYKVIHNYSELIELVTHWYQYKPTLFAVDCEWGGNNFIDGKLRTIQFCWKEGTAVAIRLMDDKGNYAFDCSYTEVGNILGAWLNRPEVKYIGHHYSADSPWMSKWLNLEVYGKCVMDTEFALQCSNEHAELSLERLALSFTDIGRYDIELMCWKKQNRMGPEDGYAFIPDEILLPYSMADVDVTFRSYEHLLRMMDYEGVREYYENIFNPFVTDVFTNFAIVGLPVDTAKLDELRDLFQFAKNELEKRFQTAVTNEAPGLVLQVCQELLGNQQGAEVAIQYLKLPSHLKLDHLKEKLGSKNVARAISLHGHYIGAPTFNIRSGTQMSRWLFDVKGYTPIKSTNRKEKGFPSMTWDKVLTFPPEVRANYVPAIDKQTLQVFSVNDKVVKQLLDFNAVGNLAKSFLKPAEIDEDTGELIRENGLHFWVCSDGRVHYNSSITETARNRCWKPNVLNWTSHLNDMVSEGIAGLLKELNEAGTLPARFVKYLTEKVPSIRSIITAPPGWKMVETDYATAEIRGLAFISGCKDLIRLMTEPDRQFGYLKSNPKTEIRLGYGETCGIPPENQDPKFVMAHEVDGEWVKITEEDLLRDENGEIIHPEKTDLHWSIVELLKGTPREMMSKKMDRDAKGKVANFSCIAKNAVISTDSGPVHIHEINTGHKLWDGVDFVPHEGLIKQGKRIVIQYQGLRATPEHIVWTREGKPICLFDALVGNMEILGVDTGEHVRLHLESPYCRESPEGLACARRMQEVRSAFNEVATQFESRQSNEVSLYSAREIQGHAGNHVGDTMACNVSKVLQGQPRLKPQLQGTGNRSKVHQRGLHSVGIKNLAGRNLLGERLRQDRQRRALRILQSKAGKSRVEFEEHADIQEITNLSGREIQGTTPRLRLHPEPCTQSNCDGQKGIRNTPDVPGCLSKRTDGPAEGPEKETAFSTSTAYIGGVSCTTEHTSRVPGSMGSRCSKPGYVKTSVGSGDGCKAFRLLISFPSVAAQESALGLQSGIYLRIITDEDRGRNPEHVYLPFFEYNCKSQEVPGDASGYLVSESYTPDDKRGYDGRPAGFKIPKEIECEIVETYDILNAGPRRRFTADGIIVSNCAYGASPNSIERKIEADSGIKPEPGVGQGILDALYNRQPRAMEWLDEQQEIPRNCDHIFLASGRKRHWLGTNSKNTMDYKVWDALMSGQGREARNTPLQESVASTSAIASTRLLKFGRDNGLLGRPMVLLYDAIVTLCPDEEVPVWKKAHELFMYRSTVWRYEDRLLNYPIETEINRGWSSGEIKEGFPEFPENPRLRQIVEELDKEIAKYANDPSLGVINKN